MSKDYKRWGDEAYAVLRAINGQHSTKKKQTLLLLADAAYLGESQVSVFKSEKAAASRTAHYRWLENDEAYAVAYAFLIGTDEAPGLATAAYREEMEEQEQTAVRELAGARHKLKILAGTAVAALEEALQAQALIVDRGGEKHWYADHTNRRLAANSILDRNIETAVSSKSQQSTDPDNPPTVTHKFDLSNVPFEVLAGLAMQDGPPAETAVAGPEQEEA
jgi:hypothetical protein